MNRLFHLLIACVVLSTISCAKPQVEFQYCILRDRVVVTDRVFMKKALYAAFTVSNPSFELVNTRAKAQLFCKGDLLSESSTISSGEKTLNIVFDLPYEIPNAPYSITVSLINSENRLLAECSHTIERRELKSSLNAREPTGPVSFHEIVSPVEPDHFKITAEEKATGYVLFSRSPLEYVFPGTRPFKEELIDQLSLTVCRNEFEPVTFSLYPANDLGNVKINIEDLTGPSGIIAKDNIDVGHVELVQDTIGCPKDSFRYMPRLIRPGDQVLVEKGRTKRFWLTLRVARDVLPGAYSGNITISPQQGRELHVPLSIRVVPITLEDIPNVDYFMMMTYEFTELTMPWDKEEKEKIYQSACRILQDYKDHGMTTICPHSPFVFTPKEDGSSNLDDIFAAMRAARDIGFKRPVIWYMGHLIQTSKPKHPGNIKGFEKSIHLARLKQLVAKVKDYAAANNCPEVIFLPIDEPDDDYQDYKKRRQNITPLLLKIIHDAGAKNMLTYRNYKQFEPVDYICSSRLEPEELAKAHRDDSAYFLYNNQVTTNCTNPAYARYIYGYYTWTNKIDGMSSWTFQNTQNASGLPAKADVPGRDIFLAFPDPAGPLATLRWEAVREGIDDHKLLYHLMKRIKRLRKSGVETSRYEDFLNKMAQKQGSPGSEFGDHNGWNPVFFKQTRENLISLVLEADRICCNLEFAQK